MGCLFKSFGIFLIFILLIPFMLLFTLFGRVRRTKMYTHQHTQQDDDTMSYNHDTTDDTVEPSSRIDKPIDQSTVEYIDFEEVDDESQPKNR